jgi:hypothetical protein
MGNPVYFQGANRVLQPPKGMEESCSPLPVLTTADQQISCWQLTEEELAYINRTGCIWLSVGSQSHPPVRVAGEEMVMYDGKEPEIKYNTIVGGKGNG